MLTIFTIPKPFTDSHIKTIQTNAIKSWTQLEPRPEIFLFGNDYGVAEIAEELKINHIKDIAVNDSGTPFLDFIFEYVEKNAKYENLCYVNCDIMLFQDIIEIIPKIKLNKYLILGQRWDLDLKGNVDFSDVEWRYKLFRTLDERGNLHEPAGSDYFLYKKGSDIKMPRFLVGRAGWDNWFIYRFRKTGIPVFDCSKTVKIIHQNHTYAHIKNNNCSGYQGAESEYNRNIIKKTGGGQFCIDDSNFVYDGKVKKVKFGFGKYKFHFYAFHPSINKFILFLKYNVFFILPKSLGKDFVKNNLCKIQDKNDESFFLDNYSLNNCSYELVKKKRKLAERKKILSVVKKYNLMDL